MKNHFPVENSLLDIGHSIKMAPILIVGAGPSGLLAAATAAALGHHVILLERLSQPGQKLLATGGGRCNLTHDLPPPAFIQKFSRNDKTTARFLAPAIHHFPPSKIREWFHERGVPTVVEPDGCVFPASQNARDILVALLRACHETGVEVRSNARVVSIAPNASNIQIPKSPNPQISITLSSGEILRGNSIILATGGCSYPNLGADPAIFPLLQNLGLSITPPTPALVPLVADTSTLPQTAPSWETLAGLTLEKAAVTWQASAPATPNPQISKSLNLQISGPVLFTHRGLSGPAVLEASRDFCLLPSAFCLLISSRAERDSKSWLSLFTSWRATRGTAHLRNLLSGEVPRAWAEHLFAATNLPPDLTPARATRGNLQTLATALTAFPVPISDTEGFSRAMVTRGGVALSEINPHTLQSLRYPALRIIGEVLDLDGPCGGFNLTWAFSSAHLCASKMPK